MQRWCQWLARSETTAADSSLQTSNETAKSYYESVCLSKNKLDEPKHTFFFHRNAYSPVKFRWWSLLNLRTLMVGYWKRNDKELLWLSCLVWRGSVTARWRQHGVTLIGARRLERGRSRHGDAYTPVHHTDHIKHTLVFLWFRERPLILYISSLFTLIVSMTTVVICCDDQPNYSPKVVSGSPNWFKNVHWQNFNFKIK